MNEKILYILNSLDLYLSEGIDPLDALVATIADYAKVFRLTVGDVASPPDSGEQTRTSGQAGEGSAPHPPRA